MKSTTVKTTYTCDACGKPVGDFDARINETIGYIGQGQIPVTVFGRLRVSAAYVTHAGDVCRKCTLKALKQAVDNLEKGEAGPDSKGDL